MKSQRAWCLLLILLLLPQSVRGEDSKDVRAGVYLPMGLGGQYTPDSWGIDFHMGLGIRVFVVGIGAEAHYVYSWGPYTSYYTGSGSQALYLARFDIYPVGDLKVSALAGRSFYQPDSSTGFAQTVYGARLGYEGHPSHNFSIEPHFSIYRAIGTNPTLTYQLGVSFSIWNETLFSSIVTGIISGIFSRRH